MSISQFPIKKPEDRKPKMSRKKKVLLGVAGVLVVGGIGSVVTGGPDETPAPETAVVDPTPSETPSPEPTPEPEPEPEPEPAPTVEPPIIVDPPPPTYGPEPAPTETAETESPYADPRLKYDLPIEQDLVFVGQVKDAYPVLSDATPESIVQVAEGTCFGIDQGYSLQDQIDIAASGLRGDQLAAATGVMAGGVEFYCPEHSTID